LTSASPWRKVDKRLEDSLRMTVKKSLQELSRALNGDNKTEVIPIFNVLTILKNNRRVELKPNVQVGRSRSTLSNPR
jgi:dynein heavy chain